MLAAIGASSVRGFAVLRKGIRHQRTPPCRKIS
jgi:hypothetical protein